MESGKSLEFGDPRNSMMLRVLEKVNPCRATEKRKKKAISPEYISGQ